jgi:hypothetical protein
VKKLFNWICILAGCVGFFYGVGLIVPRTSTDGSRTNLKAQPDRLYAVVSEVDAWPQWHPDVRSVQERQRKGDHPVWRVTENDGTGYDLEVTPSDDDSSWFGAYVVDGSRYTLRFSFSWYGQGGRVHATRTIDTRDTWKRARDFFWSRSETGSLGLLNALADHLGEDAVVEKVK